MKARRLLIGLGTAVTTFLLVLALGGELLAPFAEATGQVELATLALAALIAIMAGALVTMRAVLLSQMAWGLLAAYAAFGITYVLIWAVLTYELVADTSAITPTVHLGASILVALVAALVYLRGRSRRRAAAA